jgi:hypothetical protein
MPTDESRLPLMPILPWQRPPVTRNAKGRWMAGVSGNPRGRPECADARQDARLRRARKAAHHVQWDDRHGPGKGWQSRLRKILARATRGRPKDEPTGHHPMGAGCPQDFARKGNHDSVALSPPHPAPPCLCEVEAPAGTGSPQRPGAGTNSPSPTSDPPRGT